MLIQDSFRCTRSFFHRIVERRQRARLEASGVAAMRRLCQDMIRDLGDEQQASLEVRIDRARDLDDFWHLRAHLFGAIALEHGERVAHERVRRFDTLAN